MKKAFFISIFIITQTVIANAQFESYSPGKTYAVVIGISQYQNTAIPLLNYAGKDATIFADWLKSSAGGSVPDYQIKLHINEDASIASIYNSLNWLLHVTKQNDRVYFYFSGHGDVEIDSASISQGYLLAWNSPQNNYANNAISVEDINKLANTLSIENKAEVILITDACHSGKMAGNFFKGKQLTASNLQIVLNNEVRMASCAVDEEAAEGPAWGGGRGVFSYYLIQALNGIGNSEKYDTVKIRDISNFLVTSFAGDKVLARDKHKQHPVIDGNPYFTVAVVDSFTKNIYKEAFSKKNIVHANPPAGLQSLKSLGPQPLDYFIQIFRNNDLEAHINFEKFLNQLPEKIPVNIVDDCLHFCQTNNDNYDSLDAIKNELYNTRAKLFSNNISTTNKLPRIISLQVDSLDILITSVENKLEGINNWQNILNIDTLSELKKQLLKNKSLITHFNEKFIQIIHEKAQDMINAYLTGDIAELEKRQYYYSGTRSYGSLLPSLQLAASLVQKNDFLYQILNTQYFYISGLVSRLQMAISTQKDSLLNIAFKQQYQALQWQPYAAYIHNELGNLYINKENYDSAEYHFNIAAILAPTWAIPWSNRIRMYLAVNKLAKAKEAISIANSLQPNLSYVNVNAGLVMEKDNNWLAAETYYMNAIAKNNVHYLPFERLGLVYLKTGEYAKADYYLYQAKKRKEQFAINENIFNLGIELGGANTGSRFAAEKLLCTIATTDENKQIIPYTLLATALQNLSSLSPNLDDIIATLKKVIQLKPGIPLAYHFLGKLLYKKENWPEAKKTLQQSIVNFQSDTSFYQPIFKSNFATKDSCLLDILNLHQFYFLEDYYLLASIYEKIDSVDKAIKQYRIISSFENTWQMEQADFNNFMSPENKLWSLLHIYNFTSVKVYQSKNKLLKVVKLPIEPDKNLDYSFEISNINNPSFIFIPLQQNDWDKFLNKFLNLQKIIFYQMVDNEIVFSDDPGVTTLDIKVFLAKKIVSSQNNKNEYLIYQYETPILMGGTIKAARLSELRGNYLQAEEILLNQVFFNQMAANVRQQKFVKGIYGPANWAPFNFYWLKINRDLESETYNFYTRMITQFPRNYYWQEQAGLFLYKRLALTYHQMPIYEQTSFYEKSKEYAYPYMAADDTPDQPDVVYELPGSLENIFIKMPAYDPLIKAVEYLQESIKLSGDEHPQRKVLEPLAELNSWIGNVDKAEQYYSAVLEIQPGDVKFRNKFIAYLFLNSRYTDAYNQLDSLYKRNQLNHEQIIKLAELRILKNPQTNLTGLFKNYLPINKNESNILMILYAKQNLLQSKYKKALACLQDSIKNISTKEVNEFARFNTNTDPAIFRLYASASLFAILNQDKKALQTLKIAFMEGFNYKYVLDTDKIWNRFRKTKQWKLLLNNYPAYINYENITQYSDDYKAPVGYRFPKLDIH